jgi:hypothetical protein
LRPAGWSIPIERDDRLGKLLDAIVKPSAGQHDDERLWQPLMKSKREANSKIVRMVLQPVEQQAIDAHTSATDRKRAALRSPFSMHRNWSA